MTYALCALAVVVGVLVFLVVGLLRSHAEILMRLDQLGQGIASGTGSLNNHGSSADERLTTTIRPVSPSSEILEHLVMPTVRGMSLELELAEFELSAERPTLLAFLSTGCLTCVHFFESLDRSRASSSPDGVDVVIVTKGREEENLVKLGTLAPTGVPLVMSTETWERFDVPGSPFFALLDERHRFLGAGSANSWPQVGSLVADSLEERRIVDGRGSREGSPRMAREDRDLLSAGIGPDHPSLYGGMWSEAEGEVDGGVVQA